MPASTLLKSLSAATSAIVLLYAASIFAADVDEYLEEARQFIADGKTKSAVIQLKNALQSDPANLEARLMLAGLYLRNGDGASAAKEYRRARALDAANAGWLPGYARALMLQGAYRELLTEVEADEALPPEARAELLALRGHANLALRQIDAAVIEYDAALALDSGNPAARLGKAQILLLNGEDQQAVEQLDNILLDHPGHVQSLLARGDLLRRLKRIEEAETDYARVLEEAPANPRARIGLALIHLSQRDTAAARQDLDALNRLAPNLPAGTYLQALLSFQEKDYDRASDELQRLLGSAPGNLQAQLLYGIVSYARGEFTIADDYLTRVFASLPGNLQLAKLLGASRLKLRQPDRAVAVLSSVVDENTQDVQLLALMGTAYLQVGDNSNGAEYIQRAVELDPDQALLRTQLAVGRLVTGDTTAAISELESAVALGQDVLQADVLLVLSYLKKQEFEKAIAASQALQKRMSDSPIPYNLIGLAYLSERKLDLARENFNLALEKDPEFLVARMNLARLAVVERQLGEAAAAYEAVLRQDPKHLQAMMGMAALAKAQNDGAGAERWLLRANQTNPKALQPILVLAENYLRQNEGLKANNLFTGLDPQQAEQPAVLRLKGMAQLQNGDFANAIYTLKKLTESQPAAIEGWFQLARAQAAAGDAASARVSFERATALDAEHKVPVVWVGLGELELREKRYDAALKVAQTIQANFSDSVFGYDIEAAAYRGKGQVS
ncbi:MAG: XrtA/PEP-CTERM system TPR-repeat protein PrsT, partial [Sedimenticolaceae bacterium]